MTVHLIHHDPAKVPLYSEAKFMEIAHQMADNHHGMHGELTAAIIRRLIGMVGR